MFTYAIYGIDIFVCTGNNHKNHSICDSLVREIILKYGTKPYFFFLNLQDSHSNASRK